MKKLILILLIATTNTSYASFPVTNKTQIEVIEKIKPEISIYGSTPIWGILSITSAALSLIMYLGGIEMWILAWILGILALIFGAIGFSRELSGLAITGFILGCLETIFLIVVAALWVMAWS